MPRAKPRPEPTQQQKRQPGMANGTPDEVLTLVEAAEYLRLSELQVIELVHSHGLPARFLGSECRFLKSAIQDWLRTGVSTKSSKEAWLSLVGSCNDDPDLEVIVEKVYRQRNRPVTEDGSYKNFSTEDK
jgi:excisionase family DNA binding protein